MGPFDRYRQRTGPPSLIIPKPSAKRPSPSWCKSVRKEPMKKENHRLVFAFMVVNGRRRGRLRKERESGVDIVEEGIECIE